MTNDFSDKDLKDILEIIQKHQDGASIDVIYSALIPPPTKRTLQRKLNDLIEKGQIVRKGRARATVYLLPTQKSKEESLEEEKNISLSKEGLKIQSLIGKPVQAREPVGYNRNFLDSYRPNETFYLSEDIRKELFETGKVADDNTPAGTYARKIFDRLLIDLSWNSSRLEGNTYSLLETERLLSAGEEAEGKDARESQMILNHKRAIEFLIDSADETDFNRYTILNLHALLSDNLLSDPTAVGRLRTVPVGVGKTVFHPLEVPQQIEECFMQVLDTAKAIKDPFEKAFFVMVHLPYLQPFEDVNKRVSRLSANIPMIKNNICPLSFVDVPQKIYVNAILGVYELNRIELLRDVFVWAYKRSCARYSAIRQSLGEPDVFRLKYRNLIAENVSEIVRSKMDKAKAISFIRKEAEAKISKTDQPRFIEVVETELMSLHEGNIARYRLRPSEYNDWHEIWR